MLEVQDYIEKQNAEILSFCENIEEDVEYRNYLIEKAQKEGAESLHEELKKIDPVSAENIDKNNIRRVARALEIYKVTGRTKTELDKASQKEVKYDYRMFGLNWEREKLYSRIDLRVDKMLEEGLIDEVKDITEKFEISRTALQGLGYKEVIDYLNGNLTYDEMVEKLKLETRHYAKRQLTWFRRDSRITWLEPQNAVEEIIKSIKE